jgi:Arc/MetJ-type ribon-helix-helix transcriptional regulator
MAMTSIELPESLYNRIEARVRGSKFASVSDYVSFVLRERLVMDETSQSHFTREEEEKIKDRLRALGYL